MRQLRRWLIESYASAAGRLWTFRRMKAVRLLHSWLGDMRISALNRKLLRDLWHLRGQVFTVGLIVASGIATYVTMRGSYESIERAQRDYYTRYRFADVFAQLKRAPNSLATTIAALPGV